jgi:hypothetical protein
MIVTDLAMVDPAGKTVTMVNLAGKTTSAKHPTMTTMKKGEDDGASPAGQGPALEPGWGVRCRRREKLKEERGMRGERRWSALGKRKVEVDAPPLDMDKRRRLLARLDVATASAPANLHGGSVHTRARPAAVVSAC